MDRALKNLMQAQIAVERIIRDLRDRRGIGAEWDQIDEPTQQEIRREWGAVVADAIAEATHSTPPGTPQS